MEFKMHLSLLLILTALVQRSLGYGGIEITNKERGCITETGADEDEYNWALVLPQVSHEAQCAILCYFKFLGYFDYSGELLNSGFDILYRRIGGNHFSDKCKSLLLLDEPNKCKLAYMFAKCEDKYHPLTIS